MQESSVLWRSLSCVNISLSCYLIHLGTATVLLLAMPYMFLAVAFLLGLGGTGENGDYSRWIEDKQCTIYNMGDPPLIV
ncbi:hypothetical protein ACFX2F_044304 [Malus domestica]